MHPLNESDFRLRRAREHLVELEAVNEVYIKEDADIIIKTISTDVNPQTGNPQLRYTADTKHPIPGRFPIIVGEIAYNLRASLDYLVYRLAIRDSGSIQKGTQFPIEDTPEKFRRRRKSRLKGINDAHAAMIERLQPYNGVDWMKRLVAISNPDKHRHLTLHARRNAIATRFGAATADPTAPFPAEVPGITVTLPHGNMQVQFFIALFVAFDDGRDVIRTLHDVVGKVSDTLTDFKPEF
jgi:hypothetical protein